MAYFYTTKKHLDELTGVVEVTSEHTLAEPNQYVVATSGTFDVNLPDSPNPGDEFYIKNIGSGVVTVTGGASPTSNKLINGEEVDIAVGSMEYTHIVFIGEGVGWKILDQSIRFLVTATSSMYINGVHDIVLASNDSAPTLFFLPLAGVPGKTITFKNISISTTHSLSAAGSDTIDGGSVLEVNTGTSVDLMDTGSEWIVI